MPADRTITSGKARTYKSAGVNIDAGNALVEAIKPLAGSTARSGADADLGGFGGLFDLRAAGFKDPLLVAATDNTVAAHQPSLAGLLVGHEGAATCLKFTPDGKRLVSGGADKTLR